MSLENAPFRWNRGASGDGNSVTLGDRGSQRAGLGAFLALACLCPTLVAQPAGAITIGGQLAHPSRVLAKFADPDARHGIAPAAINGIGIKIERRYSLVPGLVLIEDPLRAPASLADPDEVAQRLRLQRRIEALKDSGLFEYVEPDYYDRIFLEPNDAAYLDGRLWGLRNFGQGGGVIGADIAAAAAWDLTTGTNTVVVAVIDTGIRYTHQELEEQMWTNPGETPGDGIDDDGNGWVDDVYGINAVANTGDPMDDNDHGTHVAGTIGAAANDGNPHVGVAWNVSLMACKAFDQDGFGSTSAEILCIDYAVEHGARILNNSWGGYVFSQSLFDSIQRSRDAGVLFVAAAGNEARNNDVTPAYPASYQLDNIISVAAVDRSDNLASFSNRGMRSVHLGAPGVEIYSSVAGSDSDYDVFDGTSMATPHVCGVAALVLSYYPTADLDEIRSRILSSTVPIASLNRRTITGGRVNAYNALTITGDGLLEVSVDPPSGSTLLNGSPQPIIVRVRDRFSIRDATVTGRIVDGAALSFRNDGQSPDEAADDAYYSARVQVPATGDSLSVVLTVAAPDKVGLTNTVSYSLAPRPMNDPFATPSKSPAAGSLYVSNNRFATMQPGEPAHGGISNSVASVWWTYTSPTATNVLVDATGTGFDGVIAVYTGNVLSNLTAVASSTTATTNSAGRPRPHLFFDAEPMQTYSIALAGVRSNAYGSLRLRIAPGGALQTEPPEVTINSPQSGLTVTDSLLTVAGTAKDTGPNASGVTEVLVSLNESLAAPANGTTTWSQPVYLRPGANRVRVRSVNAAGLFSGTKTLDVRYLVPRPANDDFSDASLLDGTEGTAQGQNDLASLQPGEPLHTGNSGGHSLWWNWTAPADGSVELSTQGSSFDTLLAVYLGDLVNQLTPVASNDDEVPGSGYSKLRQAVRAQTLYRVAVDGYNGATGAVQLAYAFTPATVYNVTLSVGEGGSTTPAAGQLAVEAESAIQFMATPNAAFEFARWEGDVNTSENPVSVVVPRDLQIRAVFRAQAVADDFETGDLTRLPWQTAGAAPWLVTSNSAAQGTYSVSSGAITGSQSSTLRLTQEFREGQGSFSVRVSSEPTWDYLEFSVDSVRQERWSGEMGWTSYQFPITAGTHTLEWRYVKDPANSVGLDAAFMDNLVLPLVLPPDGTRATLSVIPAFSGGVEVRLRGQTNQTYVIEASDTVDGRWRGIHTNQAVGGQLYYIDPDSKTLLQRFYRGVGP